MRKAFSLIEVLVAAAISVAIIVPLSAIFQQSVHQTSSSYDEVRASFLARELVEQIQLMPYVTGYNGIWPLSHPSESAPWVDLSKTELRALFPQSTNKNKKAESMAMTCLNLTPLPEKFGRFIKLYPVIPNEILQLDVMIQWMAPHSTEFNRQLRMSTLISRDQITEGLE